MSPTCALGHVVWTPMPCLKPRLGLDPPHPHPSVGDPVPMSPGSFFTPWGIATGRVALPKPMVHPWGGAGHPVPQFPLCPGRWGLRGGVEPLALPRSRR